MANIDKRAKKAKDESKDAIKVTEAEVAANNGKKTFNYVGNVNKFLIGYAVLFAVAAVYLAIFGLEVAIEFKGGTLLTYSYNADVDLDEEAFIESVKATITEKAPEKAEEYEKVSVAYGETLSDGASRPTISLSFSAKSGLGDSTSEISESLAVEYKADGIKLESGQDVNPSSGSSFFLKCLMAVAVSFVLLIIYITFRFTKIGGISAAVFAIIALLLDVLVVFSAFIFFRFPISSNFIAVALTILGYSINNTIVVYDRIRENQNLMGKKSKMSKIDLVNKSSSQSFTRSLFTTITTVSSLVVMVIVAWIAGVSSIMMFVLPMLCGMVTGYFSSLYVSAELWAKWGEHKKKSSKKIANA